MNEQTNENLLDDRFSLVISLRKQGVTFTEIAKRLGISWQRVQQLYNEAINKSKNQGQWWNGMSERTINFLNSNNLLSKKQVKKAIIAGTLHPLAKPKLKGFGWTVYSEIRQALGLLEIPESGKKPLPIKCPYCGEKFFVLAKFQ